MAPRKVALCLTLLVVTGAIVSTIAYVSPTTASNVATTLTSTHTMKVGDLNRTWVEIDPSASTVGSTPILVVLSGVGATPTLEISRDQLVPLVTAGRAELIYPVGFDRSWNAGGCCGAAGKQNVNDVAFLQALVAQVDPQHRRPIYLTGYSNGGRLAYRIACTDPTLFNAMAVVKAMPQPGCVVSEPLTIVQLDSTNDPHIPYQPGDPGTEQPAVTTEIAHLRSTNGCALAGTVVTRGSLQLKTWTHCKDGHRLALAIYTGGKHSWPPGNATTPSAAAVIWSFFSNSAIG